MSKISLHHVGGRSGSRGFPVLKLFEKDNINVLYEADKDCIKDIVEKNKKLGSEFHVLPYCVGGVNGKATFNINYDPFTSSLLSLNPEYSQYYHFNGDGQDYILGEVCRLEKSLDIDISTLDSISKTNNIQSPDFLSLDTEGYEYEILSGAEELLENNVLGLVVEVQFKQFHKDQKLFGDINAFLTARGFEFIKFVAGLPEYSPYRAPTGLRAEGHYIATDAFYLKRESAIGRKTNDDYVKLLKLAFFSIVFQQLETGLKYLSTAKEIPISQEIYEDLKRYSYYKFLLDLEEKAGQIDNQYPPKFTEKYTTYEACRLRNDWIPMENKESNVMTPREKIITRLKQNESLYKILRSVRHAPQNTIHQVNDFVNRLKLKIPATNSPVEQLLCDHGFDKLFMTVKSKRLGIRV